MRTQVLTSGLLFAAQTIPALSQGLESILPPGLGSLLNGLDALLNTTSDNFTVVEAFQLISSIGNQLFNATDAVAITGEHAFIAPGPNDARGPCPGLNALANHGYISRSGVVNIAEVLLATNLIYGLSSDFGVVLTGFTGLYDGPLAAFSLDGMPHTGLSGSHGNFESDSSPIRGDLYQYGNNVAVVMSQFLELYNSQPDAATANYDLDVLTRFRQSRFNQSISENPLFFYGPLNGVIFSQKSYAFIYRLMANHTAEEPEGVLNKEVLKSFFSISGPENDLTWIPGNERIPENWYRRSNPYGLFSTPRFFDDTETLSTGMPQINRAGCNMGKTDSYVEIYVDESNQSFSQSPLCFGLAFANAQLGKYVVGPNYLVEQVLLPIQNQLGCTTVHAVNETVAQACPGYTQFGGPNAETAPGAIQ